MKGVEGCTAVSPVLFINDRVRTELCPSHAGLSLSAAALTFRTAASASRIGAKLVTRPRTHCVSGLAHDDVESSEEKLPYGLDIPAGNRGARDGSRWPHVRALSLLLYLLTFARFRIPLYFECSVASRSLLALDPRLSADVYRHPRQSRDALSESLTKLDERIQRDPRFGLSSFSYASLPL